LFPLLNLTQPAKKCQGFLWYNIYMLKKGTGSMQANMTELMTNIDSASRRKAIMTIAKKNNISFEEAQYRQAQRISESQLRKK
jgi:esterase/lipase superfamily enzyme